MCEKVKKEIPYFVVLCYNNYNYDDSAGQTGARGVIGGQYEVSVLWLQ